LKYAFEATKHYLAHVQNNKSIKKVIAITLPGNSNSINLLEKLGLK
jgi:RimJ/RimL family protein N-acetyltransferase